MIRLLKSFFEKNVFPIRDKLINAPGGDPKTGTSVLSVYRILIFQKHFFCQILF